MKAMKKKIFTKAMFLALALMLMLTPLNLGVFAETAEMPEIALTDEYCECCTTEASVVIGEQPMVVEMASGCSSHSWYSYSSENVTKICDHGSFTVKKQYCSNYGCGVTQTSGGCPACGS